MIAQVALFFLFSSTTVLAAVIRPCYFPWLTTNPEGKAWTDADGAGEQCVPGSANACNTGPNAFCFFTIYSWDYRCCHDVYSNIAIDLTPNGLEKPRCPQGSQSYWVNSTYPTSLVTCNIANLQNQGCPKNYKCVRASNAATGAASVPNLCCMTSTLTSFNSTFYTSGLTPSIVPVAPNSAIDSITYGTVATIYQGDNFSSVKTLFTDTDTPTITLATYTPSATKFYHLLIFDATTNKGILLFQTDITGAAVTPATKKIVASGTGATAHNIKPDTTVATDYKYTNGGGYYSPGALATLYPTTHTYVVLLFETTAALVAGTPNLAAGGVLDPNNGGSFTTVTAFLKSSSRTPLGTLVAGMYYYM